MLGEPRGGRARLRQQRHIAGRWLVAHGAKPDGAWAPELWGERILYWTAYAPYILSSRDAGYRSAILNTLVFVILYLPLNIVISLGLAVWIGSKSI